MNPYLTQILLDKYPKLFSNKQFFGFECGDGWYDILDYLCGAISEYTYLDVMSKSPYDSNEIYVDQVKEKFGRLRFYLSKEDDVMHGMVSMAEYMSSQICETCGERGQLRTGSWLVTLCDMHDQTRTGKIPHGHT
jgi:hypothetical protein